MDTTNLDHPAFSSRLSICINKAGGAGKLADACGIHRNTMRGYLIGREPSRDVIIKIAAASGVSCEWLVTGSDPKEYRELMPNQEPKKSVRELVDAFVASIEKVIEQKNST